jgi:VWFA-related protein
MPLSSSSLRRHLLAALLCSCLSFALTQAQQNQPPPSAATEVEEDDTVRISTELIQTGVTVFDKQGRFVDKLAREDFELRVDGKLVPVSFFERASGASGDDQTKTVGQGKTREVDETLAEADRRGRTVIFFVDDFHLALDSHKRARDMIRRFIDRELEEGDIAAIASTSGKIGFLQQFTDDKLVLNAALERLKYNRISSTGDRRYPPMSEYEALLIDRGDQEVMAAFVSVYLREGQAVSQEDAQMQIHARARTLLHLAGVNTKNTYATLEQLMRKSAQLNGRKVVFFISDGFLLDLTNTDSSSRLNRIADAAARANAVVYSFDAKGLDASLPEGIAGTQRVNSGERWELQDPLNALAEKTGGRFIRNNNDLQGGMTKVLAETSIYYLLAWRPDPEKHVTEKFRRIQVSVKGRPELQVRVQSGYLEERTRPAKDESKIAKAPVTAAEGQLRSAFNALTPKRELPTSMVVNYMHIPKDGPLLALALQIESDAVEFTQANDNATAEVDVVGVIFNSQGAREGSFSSRLTAKRPASHSNDSDRSDIYFNYQAKLKPGLYQIRAATRDVKSGRTGSATQWIEIPDMASRRLALSSLLLGERATDPKPQQAALTTDLAPGGIRISVDRRFASTSHLRYVLYIYNSAQGQTGKAIPNVALQTQILRNSSSVLTSPSRQVSTEGQDPSQLAYAAEVPLKGIPPGRYVLQVTAVDRIAKTSAMQRVAFEIK